MMKYIRTGRGSRGGSVGPPVSPVIQKKRKEKINKKGGAKDSGVQLVPLTEGGYKT